MHIYFVVIYYNRDFNLNLSYRCDFNLNFERFHGVHNNNDYTEYDLAKIALMDGLFIIMQFLFINPKI